MKGITLVPKNKVSKKSIKKLNKLIEARDNKIKKLKKEFMTKEEIEEMKQKFQKATNQVKGLAHVLLQVQKFADIDMTDRLIELRNEGGKFERISEVSVTQMRLKTLLKSKTK